MRPAQGVEDFDQLLAPGFVVPGFVAADQLQQLVDRALGIAPREQGQGKIEPRLIVFRIGFDGGAQLLRITGLTDFLGQLQGFLFF